MMNKRRAAERATITARLQFLDAEERHSKPNVMDGHDHTECANKVRKAGYWHTGVEYVNGRYVPRETWIADPSTTDCKYDRKRVDPACAAANCKMIGEGK